MKQIMTLICLITLTGCAAYVPMEELRAQALRSGDWTEVEKRERILAKRESRAVSGCPAGTMAMCQEKVSGEECHCIDRNSMQKMLTSW